MKFENDCRCRRAKGEQAGKRARHSAGWEVHVPCGRVFWLHEKNVSTVCRPFRFPWMVNVGRAGGVAGLTEGGRDGRRAIIGDRSRVVTARKPLGRLRNAQKAERETNKNGQGRDGFASQSCLAFDIARFKHRKSAHCSCLPKIN